MFLENIKQQLAELFEMRLANKLFTCLAILISAACSSKYQLGSSEKQLYPISTEITPDKEITSFYKPFKENIDSIMNVVVGVSNVQMIKEQPEGTLNNFFADAMYDTAKDRGINFDFAYTNSGGLRVSLPKGDIYRYKIFELMPFENYFVTVKFSGADTKLFFDYMAASGGDPISGATYLIDNDKATEIIIGGKPINIAKEYTVLTSDYMANGGDGGAIFTKAKEKKELNFKLRDALFQYIEKQTSKGENLNPVKDGRIKIK